MKDKAIIRMKLAAERDKRLTGDAFRVLCRICSMIYVNPKASVEKAFPLPWSKVALWCGLSDDKAASRRIWELVDAGYLKCDGLRGCPGINHYFLLVSYPSKGATSCPQRGATVTPSKGATSCPSEGAHHIFNSLQEEKINQKRGSNGSLRSAETQGGIKSSLRSEKRVEDGKAATLKFYDADERRKMWDAAKAAIASQLETPKATTTIDRGTKSNRGKDGEAFEVKK